MISTYAVMCNHYWNCHPIPELWYQPQKDIHSEKCFWKKMQQVIDTF